MKRRNFLLFSTIVGVSTYLKAEDMDSFDKEFNDIKPTLEAVLMIMFPDGSDIPSAKSMNIIGFLYDTMKHSSFDKDIRVFIIDGAKKLKREEKDRFISYDNEQKEKALREYEATSYGKSWLSNMMTFAIEGMFCDPIYGANIDQKGWSAIDSYGGSPRPQKRYII